MRLHDCVSPLKRIGASAAEHPAGAHGESKPCHRDELAERFGLPVDHEII